MLSARIWRFSGPVGWRIGTPALLAGSAHDARRFWEFFTANIRHPHTRRAYHGAVGPFAAWCDRRDLDVVHLEPILIAAYIEELDRSLSMPPVKQHLAAIRMLFDWMVLGQVVRMNPASAVRGPQYVMKKGKTPVVLVEEARDLLNSIETNTVKSLRVGRCSRLCRTLSPGWGRDRDADRKIFPTGKALVVPPA